MANLWRESLNCAFASSNSTPESVRSLASSLAQTMTEIHDYTSVATIHADYLEDIPQAAKFLCRAFRFADGIALLKTRGLDVSHPDLITTGLAEAMATMTELLADCKGQLNAQVPRIRELRAAKASDPVAYYDHAGNANAEGADVPDDVSLAPTDASTAGVTLFTRYTNISSRSSSSRKTSRNRRREERKRAGGKRGTIYEEEYLVASVGRLIDRVNSVNEDVGRLVAGLASRGKREEAKAVRNAIKEVVEMCRSSTEEVFQVDNLEGGAGVRPSGGDGVLFDSEEEQRHPKKEVPVVKGFEGFSFLGK
jgi:elongator complex protein 1